MRMEDMFGSMNPEDMGRWMEQMFAGMKHEEMRRWMDAMPSMMESCCGAMDAAEIGSIMEGWMPKMMRSCFSMMGEEKHQEMIDVCRDMLERMERKGTTEKT